MPGSAERLYKVLNYHRSLIPHGHSGVVCECHPHVYPSYELYLEHLVAAIQRALEESDE